MSEKRPPFACHAAGLAYAAVVTVCIAFLWTHGLSFLRGTVFEDLSSIVGTVVSITLLTLAERLLNRVMRP